MMSIHGGLISGKYFCTISIDIRRTCHAVDCFCQMTYRCAAGLLPTTIGIVAPPQSYYWFLHTVFIDLLYPTPRSAFLLCTNQGVDSHRLIYCDTRQGCRTQTKQAEQRTQELCFLQCAAITQVTTTLKPSVSAYNRGVIIKRNRNPGFDCHYKL